MKKERGIELVTIKEPSKTLNKVTIPKGDFNNMLEIKKQLIEAEKEVKITTLKSILEIKEQLVGAWKEVRKTELTEETKRKEIEAKIFITKLKLKELEKYVDKTVDVKLTNYQKTIQQLLSHIEQSVNSGDNKSLQILLSTLISVLNMNFLDENIEKLGKALEGQNIEYLEI